jgi:twitching motility two-component system response regulator PilH
MMANGIKNILVIDDDPGVVAFLQKRLDAAGYRVTVADTGESGLQKMRAELPELVIADVIMPGMDGFSFVREIRSDAALTKIPIVIVTAQEELADIFKMESVQGFFAKPIDTELLMEKIHALIG